MINAYRAINQYEILPLAPVSYFPLHDTYMFMWLYNHDISWLLKYITIFIGLNQSVTEDSIYTLCPKLCILQKTVEYSCSVKFIVIDYHVLLMETVSSSAPETIIMVLVGKLYSLSGLCVISVYSTQNNLQSMSIRENGDYSTDWYIVASRQCWTNIREVTTININKYSMRNNMNNYTKCKSFIHQL